MRRLLLAAVATAGLVPAGRAADKSADLTYVPPTAPIVVTVDGAKLRKNLADLGAPVDKYIAKVKDRDKLELEKLSRMTVFLDLFPTAETRAALTFVMTTKEANAKDVLLKWLDGATEVKVAGKPAIKSKEKLEGQDMYGTVIDANTALLGTEATLTTLLKGETKATDLSKEFEKTDLKHDAVVVVAMKPLFAKLKDRYGDLDKQMPPQAEPFWAMAKRLEAVSLTVDLADDTLLKGVFRADSPEGAAQVKAMLTSLLYILLPGFKKDIVENLPPEAQKPAAAVFEAVTESSKFKVDGSTVTMTVARPKDFGK